MDKTVNVRLHRSIVRRLAADQRGAALLEFAFVAPVLIAMILAITDTSLQFFAQQSIDSVTEKSSRLLLTGTAQTSQWTASQFKNQVCQRLPGFMQCSKVVVEVRKAATFQTLDTSPSTVTVDAQGNPQGNGGYNGGNPGDVVLLRVMYMWPVTFGPLGYGTSANVQGGARLMVSSSVIKTEPYS